MYHTSTITIGMDQEYSKLDDNGSKNATRKGPQIIEPLPATTHKKPVTL